MNKSSKKQQKQVQSLRPVSGQKKKSAKLRGKEPVESVPLAQSRLMRTRVPDVSGSPYSGDGRVRIRHREYIRDIPGSVAFSALSLSCNPGLALVFPWLSTIASRFESYVFRSLKFLFETQKSASTSGSVMMAMDYDAVDAAPINKQQVMAYHNAVRSAVWEECIFRGDAPDLKKFGIQRYLRSGNLAANLDVKTYDVGNFFICTQGEADTSAIGELYVEYDVELITPQIAPDSAAAASVGIFTTGASRANPFTGVQTSYGGLAVTGAGATLTFNQPGQYLLEYNTVGTVMTNTLPTITGTATVNAGAGVGQYTAGAGANGMGIYLVNVTDLGQTMIFDFTASCTTLTAASIRVAPYATSNL